MTLYESIGGAEGCQKLSVAFYARVARDPVLSPIFPKSFHCAIPAFAAYLSQFLGGGAEYSGRRWYLSLREAHARFKIGAREREAWLALMREALEEVQAPESARVQLLEFFEQSSNWIMGEPDSALHGELAHSWQAQRTLEEALTGLIALTESDVVRQKLDANPELERPRYTRGRTLLHAAADAGNLALVELLLRRGADPNAIDGGGHAPLYGVGNSCTAKTGPAVVHALVRAGALVDACGGVQRCTALHMAARRGNVRVAEALLACGADIDARDKSGATPLRRAINCRKPAIADFLRARGAVV